MFIDWEQNIMFQPRALALNKQDVNIFVRAQCELVVNRRIKWQRSSSLLIFFFFLGWLVLSVAQCASALTAFRVLRINLPFITPILNPPAMPFQSKGPAGQWD